jgi:hypothetical protein
MPKALNCRNGVLKTAMQIAEKRGGSMANRFLQAPGGKVEAEAAAVTCGTVRCSAWFNKHMLQREESER